MDPQSTTANNNDTKLSPNAPSFFPNNTNTPNLRPNAKAFLPQNEKIIYNTINFGAPPPPPPANSNTPSQQKTNKSNIRLIVTPNNRSNNPTGGNSNTTRNNNNRFAPSPRSNRSSNRAGGIKTPTNQAQPSALLLSPERQQQPAAASRKQLLTLLHTSATATNTSMMVAPTPRDAPSPSSSSNIVNLSRNQVHKLLFDLVVSCCHNQHTRWLNNEDLFDLDAEIDPTTAVDPATSSTIITAEELCAKHSFLSHGEFIIKRQDLRNRSVGVLVSAIKTEWSKRYGTCLPLSYYMRVLEYRKLKALLEEVPNLILCGSGGFMRVATVSHAKLFCKPYPPHGLDIDGKAPVHPTVTFTDTQNPNFDTNAVLDEINTFDKHVIEQLSQNNETPQEKDLVDFLGRFNPQQVLSIASTVLNVVAANQADNDTTPSSSSLLRIPGIGMVSESYDLSDVGLIARAAGLVSVSRQAELERTRVLTEEEKAALEAEAAAKALADEERKRRPKEPPALSAQLNRIIFAIVLQNVMNGQIYKTSEYERWMVVDEDEMSDEDGVEEFILDIGALDSLWKGYFDGVSLESLVEKSGERSLVSLMKTCPALILKRNKEKRIFISTVQPSPHGNSPRNNSPRSPNKKTQQQQVILSAPTPPAVQSTVQPPMVPPPMVVVQQQPQVVSVPSSTVVVPSSPSMYPSGSMMSPSSSSLDHVGLMMKLNEAVTLLRQAEEMQKKAVDIVQSMVHLVNNNNNAGMMMSGMTLPFAMDYAAAAAAGATGSNAVKKMAPPGFEPVTSHKETATTEEEEDHDVPPGLVDNNINKSEDVVVLTMDSIRDTIMKKDLLSPSAKKMMLNSANYARNNSASTVSAAGTMKDFTSASLAASTSLGRALQKQQQQH